ncbi:hypothetical protein A3K29_03750 [Candidatus Collierbacteria bacterium RIFOXYB2_FULL_46_14]|uniref:Quinoprotein glucose dehydrogenase n=1 Tax=Candidatus Collierbacteria bacterium GW2011_GWA2_46_26 TaxID=1618381 RepID=A0A0G1SHA9_9BACT|nr:MAG: Quinoprotein glucose dehydrogenase [Candidatus Collierbacteria bacterium GW2011_GWC2_44_13]KKU32695.1 MAG: Quinoprotein glucose dehydrogenase [Candidatus Collierbacteria bacterium GW2011_GWA2_46_26]OGD73229.1 MAG: hypothetical protein A3K29_03750 [Candidatus Collierbacteria bacterium RIFOXYB2_FULL_46_14]OGD76271.1 MAG: hypothetical protein A3K43_03750 [Candidatus Collierbacteria bacterium RIFOXYA2_FULL_46_20]OGD77607.1 MAG: hypothetical protein A3K39_03750 [Candidatus Collierbacteria ba
MSKLFIGLIIIFISVWIYTSGQKSPATSPTISPDSDETIIADKLQIPWSLVFLPDGSILFTERPGRVREIPVSGKLNPNPVVTLDDVKAIGEGGLLGIVLHPSFEMNRFLYLYYTYAGDEKRTLNKVVRYVFDGTRLSAPNTLVAGIPGNSNHNGGRIKFGPDGYLYITTGDSQNPSLAQDKGSLAGKILRVTDEGEPAPGNPFNNEIYSYGHRNPQGLAWDESGRLWETEHGSSAGDEVNLIEKGKNYGWPTITKTQSKEGMVTPVLNSENETWAPSGLAFVKPFMYFAGLRSNTLYRLGTTTMKFDKILKGKYGRLRDVVLGPDGYLYITTSNLDGRSLTHLDGDKIIRLAPP